MGRIAALWQPSEETPRFSWWSDRLTPWAFEHAELQAHYAQGKEWDRLDDPKGVVEFERTKEILQRRLPAAPAVSPTLEVGRGALRCGSLIWVTRWCIEISCGCMWKLQGSGGAMVHAELAMLAI